MEIKLNYGALADSLEVQLNDQGFTLADNKEFISKLHYSLTMCNFHLLTEKQYQMCINKLHKKVMEKVRPLGE